MYLPYVDTFRVKQELGLHITHITVEYARDALKRTAHFVARCIDCGVTLGVTLADEDHATASLRDEEPRDPGLNRDAIATDLVIQALRNRRCLCRPSEA